VTKTNRFHACATCQHYQVIKLPDRNVYRCSRLGFETKPHFAFNCWQPKDKVLQLMKKQGIRVEDYTNERT